MFARRAAGSIHRTYCVANHFAGVDLIQFHHIGGRLAAVAIDRRGPRLVELGTLAEIDDATFDLRRRLRQLVAGRPDGVDAARRGADRLAGLMCPPIDGDRALVLAPLPVHRAVPWALLDPFAHRPVTVARSLGHWSRTPPWHATTRTRIGVASGPGLVTGDEESTAVVAAWQRPSAVHMPATVAQASAMLASVDVAHIACHGEHRPDAGRFAQLRLADGGLTAFELERLHRAPR